MNENKGCPPPQTEESSCCSPTEQQPSEPACCPTEPATTASCCPSSATNAQSCCPSSEETADCCPGPTDDRPGYKLWPFVSGWIDTPVSQVPRVAERLTRNDILGRWQMRWGLGRMRYTIAPGLYAVGNPDSDSPVVVTANYKMTFDIVRRELACMDVWIMVLDTKGINVWCAAGKGTFGTEELVRRIKATELAQLVSHRTLIVPQLGAPGVAAHIVKKQSGFKVAYGPVRAADLPEFIDAGLQATPQMRRVTFTAIERLVLTPVELVGMWQQFLWSLLAIFIISGIGPEIFSFSAAWSRGSAATLVALSGVITGAFLVPLLLPWIPGRSFATKGALAGLVVGFLVALTFDIHMSWLDSLGTLLAVPPIASWCAMHFTGSSTFTSPSGVEKEMRQAIPAQAAVLIVAISCLIVEAF